MTNIACWSGPRNLSTAMMYAFGARRDCAVLDEPFYAAYLAATGLDHPMSTEIIAAGQTDPKIVAAACGTQPTSTAHCYQKHMSHHMIEAFDRSWFSQVRHVFLIRHPARVLASYAAKRAAPSLADIGFVQQCALYETVVAAGYPAVVIDSYDVRQAPGSMLRALCQALALTFDPAMLSWPRGGHPSEGIWAAHWYDGVHASTGFAGPEGPLPELSSTLSSVADAAMPYYTKLKNVALR
ncbi:MAG: HAD family hydrolase [Pseudomonadota bacterium]